VSNALLTWALDHSKAAGSARFVLVALADRADDDGCCWPSLADIARRTTLSERQVRRRIGELVKLGELVRVKPGGGTHPGSKVGLTTRYRINADADTRTPMTGYEGQYPDAHDRVSSADTRTPMTRYPDTGDTHTRTPMSGEPSVRTVREPSGADKEARVPKGADDSDGQAGFREPSGKQREAGNRRLLRALGDVSLDDFARLAPTFKADYIVSAFELVDLDRSFRDHIQATIRHSRGERQAELVRTLLNVLAKYAARLERAKRAERPAFSGASGGGWLRSLLTEAGFPLNGAASKAVAV
jgi:hypothetical protein